MKPKYTKEVINSKALIYRTHVNVLENGKAVPKKSFRTLQSATNAADKIYNLYGKKFIPYKCEICNSYHLSSKNKHTLFKVLDLVYIGNLVKFIGTKKQCEDWVRGRDGYLIVPKLNTTYIGHE